MNLLTMISLKDMNALWKSLTNKFVLHVFWDFSFSPKKSPSKFSFFLTITSQVSILIVLNSIRICQKYFSLVFSCEIFSDFEKLVFQPHREKCNTITGFIVLELTSLYCAFLKRHVSTCSLIKNTA